MVERDSLILRSDLNSLLAPEDRLTDGVLRTVCLILFLLTFFTRRRAGCTLLGGLRSMSVSTELGIGGVRSRGSSSHDQQLLVALSLSLPDLP